MPHTLASQTLLDEHLPSVRDLGFVRAPQGRRSQPPPQHAHLEKIEFLWRAAQSGKTRTMKEIIETDEAQAPFLNIVICANIQLQAAQTAARMRDNRRPGETSDSDESVVSTSSDEMSGEDRIDANGVFTWMAVGPKVNTLELAHRINEGEIRMVVCCSNKVRFGYIKALIKALDKSRNFRTKIKIWIDEADASVKLWSNRDLDFTEFGKVQNVCPVSATFNSVVKQYGRIKVLPFDTNHPWCYVPLKECVLMSYDGGLSPEDHVISVLENTPSLCRPGMKLFAPALVERASHDSIEAVLHKFGFAVLVLNGERKEITLPNGTRIPVHLDLSDPTEPMELSVVLPEILREKDILARFPFAVTGQMCLGRGITFQGEDFMFNAGILPDLPDPAAAYQCVARMLGNMKQHVGFVVPTVFFSEKMRRMTLAQEQIAIYIAKEVKDRGWADVGVPELEHVLSQGKPRDQNQTRKVPYLTYTTVEEARAALRMLEPTYNWTTRSRNDAGFYKASLDASGKQVRSYAETIHKLPNLTGGRGETATHTRYVPCYLDTTDVSTLRYVIPIFPGVIYAKTMEEVKAALPEI
jgi:hypothetical protein